MAFGSRLAAHVGLGRGTAGSTASDLEATVVESVAEVNSNQLNNLVTQSRRGSLFHRAEWLNAIEDGLPADPCHVVVTKRGNPVAVLPTFRKPLDVPAGTSVARAAGFHELVSSYPGYGGPLIRSNRSDCLGLLFDSVSATSGPRTVHHTVRTNDPGFVSYGKPLARRGYRPLILTCRVSVDLDREWDDVVADMEKERRNALRQANDQPARVRTDPPDGETMRSVYDAYRANMERVGAEAYPFSFFEALVEHAADRLRIATAVVDGTEVGSFVFLLDDERSTVHYFFSAIADEDCYEHYPAELLHEHAMQWGIENGYDRYDFGDSSADFADGLFRYKRKYGGRIEPTVQWRRGESRLAWPAFRAAGALYRRVVD